MFAYEHTEQAGQHLFRNTPHTSIHRAHLALLRFAFPFNCLHVRCMHAAGKRHRICRRRCGRAVPHPQWRHTHTDSSL